MKGKKKTFMNIKKIKNLRVYLYILIVYYDYC